MFGGKNYQSRLMFHRVIQKSGPFLRHSVVFSYLLALVTNIQYAVGIMAANCTMLLMYAL